MKFIYNGLLILKINILLIGKGLTHVRIYHTIVENTQVR